MGERRQQEEKQAATQSNQETLEEDNDRAKDLEEKARRIDLGKNLEQRVDKKIPKPKEPKDKTTTRGKPQAGDDLDVSVAVGDQGQGADLDFAMSGAAPHEQGEKDSGVLDKKRRNDKRGKKDKKKHKKGKKRECDEEESIEEGGQLAEDESPGLSDDGLGGTVDEGGEAHSDSKLRKEKKDKKKHDKKHKKEKKHKKARHHSKHEGEDSNGEGDDAAMEE